MARHLARTYASAGDAIARGLRPLSKMMMRMLRVVLHRDTWAKYHRQQQGSSVSLTWKGTFADNE